MSKLVSAERSWEIADRRAKAIEKHMSPPGKLKGISPILEERRLKYGIPDKAFKIQASFKRIYVWQVQPWDGETFNPDGLIIKTELAQQRDKQSTPRGVILSAGLHAKDCLVSNGLDVGDLVWVVALGIYRLPVFEIDGTDVTMMVLQVGDVTGDEDTWERVQRGELTEQYDLEAKQHYYEWAGREISRPVDPFVPEEF